MTWAWCVFVVIVIGWALSRPSPQMLTIDGELVQPLRMRVTDFTSSAIATSLSRLARYNGHTLRFYSVAEHSVIIARWVMREHPAWALEALLHDASEAYLGDVIGPLKKTWYYWFYRRAEKRAMRAIHRYFKVDSTAESSAYIHQADKRIYVDELASRPMRQSSARSWKPAKKLRELGVKIEGWDPDRARDEYLNLLRELTEMTR